MSTTALNLLPDQLEILMSSDDNWLLELSLVQSDELTPVDLTGLTAALEGNPPWLTAEISDPPAGKVLLTLKPIDKGPKITWKLLLTNQTSSRVALTGTVFVT